MSLNKPGALWLLLFSGVLNAQEVPLIVVESERIADIYNGEIRSADLSQALMQQSSAIQLIRRSGIANDVLLRGHNRDNVNVLIDGVKVFGAGPNRMDPPLSHVVSSNVEEVYLQTGPFDVRHSGTLGGLIEVNNRKLSQQSETSLISNLGSFAYRKLNATLQRGNEQGQVMAVFSDEQSDPYKDGNGNDFSQQMLKQSISNMSRYKNSNMSAYQKKSLLLKAQIEPVNKHSLNWSLSANRSDKVLYPSSKMDALYDDSNVFSMDYSIAHSAGWLDSSRLRLAYSEVKHPMSNRYRMMSGTNAINERINNLSTRFRQLALEHQLNWQQWNILLGIDANQRDWRGNYQGSGMASFLNGIASIDRVSAANLALFGQFNRQWQQYKLETGFRYDSTRVSKAQQLQRTFNSISSYAQLNYLQTAQLNWFISAGQGIRIPDARELFYQSMGMSAQMPFKVTGNKDLAQVKNREFDLGFNLNTDSFSFSGKFFNSYLQDYIVYNASKMKNNFENVDAHIYGLELSSIIPVNDALYFDLSLHYQRGKKDKPLQMQQYTELANMTPLKLHAGLNYQLNDRGEFQTKWIVAKRWQNFDAENGEQSIAGYGVVNLAFKYQWNRHADMIVGIDNVFNKIYAVSNTYKDLTLLDDGSSGEVMLLNEPGRYIYFNLQLKL